MLMRKEKILFPIEVLGEIVNFLPLDSKWVDRRVSPIFDLIILKNQRQWIVFIRKIVEPFRERITLALTLLTQLKAQFLLIQDVGTIHTIDVTIKRAWNALQPCADMIAERFNDFDVALIAKRGEWLDCQKDQQQNGTGAADVDWLKKGTNECFSYLEDLLGCMIKEEVEDIIFAAIGDQILNTTLIMFEGRINQLVALINEE
ncbi:hypothetical protein ACQ4LE_006342 [Meloidogyne hapla]|uniref:F-box domain-containing protein n=1 Tax=Meloidogyne hapla TaxID=6305 RepID=A0A1I8BMD0_MELHA